MVVFRLLKIFILFSLLLFSIDSMGGVPKKRLKYFHLDLTVEVKTTFSDGAVKKGYPWNRDEIIVACGWAKITYIGHEVNHDQEPTSITVNVPIGQSCDFSDYIATPAKPKRLSLVEWGDEYYFVAGD